MADAPAFCAASLSEMLSRVQFVPVAATNPFSYRSCRRKRRVNANRHGASTTIGMLKS
jgi:hypothetical protein